MSVILAMAAFSLAMSISPGPVNMITLSIGANSGYRKALPFVSGATFGFTLLLFLIGVGLGEVARTVPYLMQILNVIGCLFICFIGYKIAKSGGQLEQRDTGIPGFGAGFLLQWLNPKAWAACFSGVAIFSIPESNSALYTFVSIYFLICFLGVGSWAVFGQMALVFLKNPDRMSVFNRVMGGGLFLAALFMLIR